MTKDKDNTTEIDTQEQEHAPRGRPPKRRKVYERVREAQIPQDVIDRFKRDGYDLRLVRWQVNGVEELSYLAHRENEGYEFVEAKELPESYLKRLRLHDTRGRPGLVTMGDLCLMKIDSELRKSRQDYFAKEADQEVEAVNVHVLEKKGFRNLGTRSRVVMREPTFSD